jgi:tetratricopeptide (TPR) repeat protein
MLCEINAWRAHWTTAEPYAGEVMHLSVPGSVPWTRAALITLFCVVQGGRAGELVPLLNLLKDTAFSPEAIGYGAHTLATGVYVLDARGQLADAEPIFQRLETLVETVAKDDPIACGWLSNLSAYRSAYAKQDPWAGLQAAEAAEARFREAGHQRATVMAQVFTGMNLWFLGALPEAERKVRETMSLEDNEGELSSMQPFCMAGVLSDRGMLEEALVFANCLVEFGQARSRPADEGRGRWALARVLLRQGDLAGAERESLASLDLLKASPLDQTALAATLAAVKLGQGCAEEALACAEEALARVESLGACGFFRGASLRLVHAECLHAAGHHEAARTAISTACEHLLAIAANIGDPEFRRSFLENVPENARTLDLARHWIHEAD